MLFVQSQYYYLEYLLYLKGKIILRKYHKWKKNSGMKKLFLKAYFSPTNFSVPLYVAYRSWSLGFAYSQQSHQTYKLVQRKRTKTCKTLSESQKPLAELLLSELLLLLLAIQFFFSVWKLYCIVEDVSPLTSNQYFALFTECSVLWCPGT